MTRRSFVMHPGQPLRLAVFSVLNKLTRRFLRNRTFREYSLCFAPLRSPTRRPARKRPCPNSPSRPWQTSPPTSFARSGGRDLPAACCVCYSAEVV